MDAIDRYRKGLEDYYNRKITAEELKQLANEKRIYVIEQRNHLRHLISEVQRLRERRRNDL